MPASKYKRKSTSKSQKQKQKQKQTVNIYLANPAKRRKAVKTYQTKARSGGVQPFYGLLNLTHPLNPTNDLGNIVNSVVSRLSVPADEKPIYRAEEFRVGRGANVPIQQPMPTASVPPIRAPNTTAPAPSRTTTAAPFNPQHATSAQDIAMSPAYIAELRNRLAMVGKGLTPAPKPADMGDPFDIHHTGNVPSPSDATLVAPAGVFNRGVDASSLGAETRVVGGLVSALPRQTSALLDTGSVAETIQELLPSDEEEELTRRRTPTPQAPPPMSVMSPYADRPEGGRLEPEHRFNIFKQHKESKIPKDFITAGGRGPALKGINLQSPDVAAQYTDLLNVTGKGIRDRLIGAVEEGKTQLVENITQTRTRMRDYTLGETQAMVSMGNFV